MKKILLAVVAVMLGAIYANAQTFNYGIKGGVNLANFTGDDVDDADMLTSFHLGVVAEFLFNDQFAIQPEVLYSAQGAKFENKTFGDVDVKLNYINVPVMFKYYVAPGFSINAGPQIGFLVNSEAEHDNNTISDIINKFGFANEDNYKSVDFGMGVGASYKFSNNMFIDGRYNFGLSKIYDEGDAKVHNGVFQFSLGYMF